LQSQDTTRELKESKAASWAHLEETQQSHRKKKEQLLNSEAESKARTSQSGLTLALNNKEK
jgi:hypothetical protein